MRPLVTLDRFTTPEGRELALHRREEDYFLYLDGEELMSSRVSGSERALAEIGCEGLERAERPRVLIGGLGLGFTLRAALTILPRGARVVVAEIFPQVVAWNRSHLSDLYGEAGPGDPRVEIEVEGVDRVIAAAGQSAWDAILLDVDNGPSEWCLRANRRLYDRDGLARARRSLRPGGVLAVWSAYSDPRFVRELEKSGFRARARAVRARGRKGSRHTIFLGRVAAA